jgi:hypothetical protein
MSNDDQPEMPGSMFWLALEHSCGCVVDWGCDARQRDELAQAFLPAAAPHPCPCHGSASGKTEPPLASGEVRYLVASNVYYRNGGDEQRENGQRNRQLALSRSRTVN